MWDFNQEWLRVRKIAEEPELDRFVSGIVVNGPGDLDANKSILSRYPMNALPMLEWSMSGRTSDFFGTLSEAGATKGYFVKYPSLTDSPHEFWECDLRPDRAQYIDEEDLFGWTTLFVDDKFSSIVSSWFSDITIWCMTPELFSTHLSNYPINTAIWTDENARWADNFDSALLGAFTRLEDWDRRTGHKSLSLRDGFEWQLSI